MPADYRFCTHAECPGLTPHLHKLTGLAFGDYDGVAVASLEFAAWYRRRPGMDPLCCQAAFSARGELAASVFITATPLMLGRRQIEAAVVDTVMTHPDHRRRGLATELMARAHDAARQRDTHVALLFTTADSAPAAMYSRMGYVEQARLGYWLGPRPDASPEGAGACVTAVSEKAISSLNAQYSTHDGFRPYVPRYWLWTCDGPYRRRRYSARLADGAGEVSVSYSAVDVADAGSKTRIAVASDWLGPLDVPSVTDLLAAAPASRIAWLSDCADNGAASALRELGFARTASEVAMALPLTPEGEDALARRRGMWYPVTESIIGV